MTTYCIPNFVAKPKPRLDNRGFREQGGKAAKDRIKKLETRLSWLEREVEELKTAQQQLSSNALRELDDTIGLQQGTDVNKGVNREDIKALIPKVQEQLNKTKAALMKETENIQDVGTKSSQLFQRFSTVKQTIKQMMITNDGEKKIASLDKAKLDEELRLLRTLLKSKRENSQLPSVEYSRESDIQITKDGTQITGADLQSKIEAKKAEISSCVEKIKTLNREAEKLQQQSKADDKKTEEEEQLEDATLKSSRRTKEDQEREEMKHQRDRKNELDELENKLLRMRTRSHNGDDIYDLRTSMRLDSGRLERLMRERDWLGDDYFRSHYARRSMIRRRYLSISSDETTDDESQDTANKDYMRYFGRRRVGNTVTQETVNRDCIRWLERQVGNTQTLERCIKTLQYYRQKLDGLENLKQVLRRESLLEQQWLKRFEASKSVGLSGPSNSKQSEPKDHLSGEHIPGDEIYNHLDKGDFRVLILLPSPDQCFPLVCKLAKWNMNDVAKSALSHQQGTKEYLALSYFWGPEVYNGRIYLLAEDDEVVPGLDDHSQWGNAVYRATPIHIRNNLFRALLRLRRHGTDANTVAVWVDFLSIQQNDVVEKTEQLGRMVDIYSKASQVCIWLGESDSGGRSDKAMEFIPTIMDFAMLERYAGDKDQADNWFALGELMRDRWFSRRWVVQEMALAKDATVHCGERAVRWSDFADAASLLVSNQERIKSLFDVSHWREGQNTLGTVESFGAWILLESTSNLFRRKPNGDIKKPIKSIEYLVTSLKTFDTGNTRDLIYSLVSIASDTSSRVWNPEDATDELAMDYNKSEIAVYQDFTKFCVRSSQSLDVICRPWAMPPEKKATLPSWIPVLAKSEFGAPEEVYTGRKNGDGLVGPVGSPNYEASGKRKCNPAFETHGMNAQHSEAEVLVTEGFKLARIKKLSTRNTGGVILHESLNMLGWKGFQQDSDGVPSEVWRTLVADRDLQGRIAPSWYQRACLRCLEIADIFGNGDLNVGQILQGDSDMLLKYLKRVQNVTWNRRFFTAVEVKSFKPTYTGQVDVQPPLSDSAENDTRGEDHAAEDEGKETSDDRHEDEESVEIDEEQTQIEAQQEGSTNGDETTPAADSSTSGNHGIEEGQVGNENNEHEASPQGTSVSGDEDEISDNGKANDARVEEQPSGEMEEGQQAGDEVTNDKTNNCNTKFKTTDGKSDASDSEASEQVKDDKEEDKEESNNEDEDEGDENEEDKNREEDERSTTKESMKSDRSESGKSESEKADSGTDVAEDNYLEVSDTESFVASQDLMEFLGLCPPETEEGDFICILFGCSVPVVLREVPDKGHMVLIGEAYVHGKMDGEAVEDDPDRPTETFHIQ
ncbi:unnamed protein product [Fusarium graminearum]|nr:hypothetical protein HG531_013518 [Fusarium graminearum]CAG1996140.1 unnamed protein product [Fusarium graminearum]